MPFKEVSIVKQREEFCRLALNPGANVRELCRRRGISPQTGYKWLDRFKAVGVEGLADQSRRPLTSPGRTKDRVEAKVLAVRKAHPAWGGRKIGKVLQNQGLASVPSASTITAILRRHQLLDGPGAGEKRDWTRFEYPERNPNSAAYDPVTKLAFVTNKDSGSATVVDVQGGRVIETIAVAPNTLEFPVADGDGRVFDNVETTGEIAVIDTKERKVTARYNLKGCEEPSGLAYSSTSIPL